MCMQWYESGGQVYFDERGQGAVARYAAAEGVQEVIAVVDGRARAKWMMHYVFLCPFAFAAGLRARPRARGDARKSNRRSGSAIRTKKRSTNAARGRDRTKREKSNRHDTSPLSHV